VSKQGGGAACLERSSCRRQPDP